MNTGREMLLGHARDAAAQAYAPYSNFPVGAALMFLDGTIVTGANVENGSYGLTLCAETVAVAKAMSAGLREGLVSVAIWAGDGTGPPVPPCGRCRQVLSELAMLDGMDPVVWSQGTPEVMETILSVLLPDAFGASFLK